MRLIPFCVLFMSIMQVSPLDDLAFDMYQDPEVARLVRRLNEKKRNAVEAEKFEAAKTYKETILKLQKVDTGDGDGT